MGYQNATLNGLDLVKTITMANAPRHLRPFLTDPSTRKKHFETVPKYKQADPNIIHQVEQLKNNMKVRTPISIPDLKAICKKYNISRVSRLEPRKLGNTGIVIVWNDKEKTFYLMKG